MRAEHRPRPQAVQEAIELLERTVVVFRGRRSTVSSRESRVLDAISELGAGRVCRLADLVEAMGVEKAELSRLVTKLEQRGLVTRTRSAEDGRERGLALTTEGERARRTPVRFDAETIQGALEEIPFEERYAWFRCLRVVARVKRFDGMPIAVELKQDPGMSGG